MASSSLLNLANPFTSSHRVDFPSSTGFRTNSLRLSAIAKKYELTKCTQFSGLSISAKGRSCSFVTRADADAEAVDVVVEEEGVGEPEESGEDSVETAEEKPPRQTRVKLGDVMGILNRKAIEASDSVRATPDLRVGDVVEIKLEVPENRRRMSIYKGIVMGKQNAGIHTTIRIRRIIAGVGVEIVFPVYSPMIKEIRVLSHRKVRRAKLYYLRDKLPRLSTFK